MCNFDLLCKPSFLETFLNQILISFIIGELLNSCNYYAQSPAITIKFPLDNLEKALNMHILQPKHTKLKEKEAEDILKKFNLSKAQLPKIIATDPGLPEECAVGDVIKIERKEPESEQINVYYRVVV